MVAGGPQERERPGPARTAKRACSLISGVAAGHARSFSRRRTKESRVLRGERSVSRGASRRFPAREDVRTKRRKRKKAAGRPAEGIAGGASERRRPREWDTRRGPEGDWEGEQRVSPRENGREGTRGKNRAGQSPVSESGAGREEGSCDGGGGGGGDDGGGGGGRKETPRKAETERETKQPG